MRCEWKLTLLTVYVAAVLVKGEALLRKADFLGLISGLVPAAKGARRWVHATFAHGVVGSLL